MAIFTKTEDAASTASKPVAANPAKKDPKKAGAKGAALTKSPVRILKGQRITEKAAYATAQGVYVFEVAMDATKQDVAAVVKAVYKVTPKKVNIVRKEPRTFVARVRGRSGIKAGMKKAYVYLEKGDKIELI